MTGYQIIFPYYFLVGACVLHSSNSPGTWGGEKLVAGTALPTFSSGKHEDNRWFAAAPTGTWQCMAPLAEC